MNANSAQADLDGDGLGEARDPIDAAFVAEGQDLPFELCTEAERRDHAEGSLFRGELV
ncbi:MAG: hypothetical protein U0807_09315 [Candidatus Binatia bacterium]